MTKRPVRRHPRLKDYDYSENGCYFVTVCTAEKAHTLSRIAVGRAAHSPPQIRLTELGKAVEQELGKIEDKYENVFLDDYVIMPNHVHLLLTLDRPDGGVWAPRPTVQTIVRTMKTMVTKKIGRSIWQASFYDHVIRNDEDYRNTREYIKSNPVKWVLTRKGDL